MGKIMDKTAKPQRKANLALILRMMLKYWYHGIAGLVMMILYAIFSGISITLVIPLFDFVFKGRSVPILYPDWQSFLGAAWSTITGFLGTHGGIFGVRSISGLKPLWHELQSVMEQTDPLALLYSICIFVFVVILLKNMFYYSNRMFFVVLRGRTIRDVRNYMFHRYLDQSMEFYNRHQVGDAIVRMVNDVDTVSNQFIYSIFNSIRDFSTIVVYMLIALTLNARLFLFSILVLPLFSLMMSFMGRKIKKYSRRIQSQLSTMFSTVMFFPVCFYAPRQRKLFYFFNHFIRRPQSLYFFCSTFDDLCPSVTFRGGNPSKDSAVRFHTDVIQETF